MKENSINHVDQSKKMKKSDCFIKEDDASNFLIIPESRNCKYGIKYMKIDQRKSCKEESLNYIHNVLDKKSKRVTMGNSSPLLGEILKEELKNRKVIILDLKNK